MAESEPGSSQVSDEEVFRRKLLMDGDGMGDSRRIDFLLHAFFGWCDGNQETAEEINDGYERLVARVSQLELSSQRSSEAQQANARQIEEYKQTYADIENKLKDVKEVVAKKKEELTEAKKLRNNKLKYDALARIIEQYPNRKESEEKLKSLQKEIDYIESENDCLRRKLESREKELAVLLNSAYELKAKLRMEDFEVWEDSESD